MDQCVIFGAGERGRGAFHKLQLFFKKLYFSDNNEALWGTQINGVPVIPPHELKVRFPGIPIIICNELHWREIGEQLCRMGLRCCCYEHGLCYEIADGIQIPFSLGSYEPYRKDSREDFSVLYVQVKPCTRTDKIAHVIKKRGVKTYSAYIRSPSNAREDSYLEEYGFWTYRELLDFVRKSEFDVIHCSNEPDELVNLLLHSGKKIIHDCHDMLSLENRNIAGRWLLEYLANTQADGCMYTTQELRDAALRVHKMDAERTMVLGNYPLNAFYGRTIHKKLSSVDGEIHCVYEGGVSSDPDDNSYRYFELIWLRLAAAGVHIHVYSQSEPDYCRGLEVKSSYIHYEGDYSGLALISEMTKYDIGLAVYNRNGELGKYLNYCSPNKLYEYLSAGLPIASNVPYFIEILEKRCCGSTLNLDRDIAGQLRAISTIKIADDFVQTHGLTMDANAERILEFYERTANR